MKEPFLLPPILEESPPPMLEKLGNYGRGGTNIHIRGSDVANLLLRGGYSGGGGGGGGGGGIVDLLPDTDSPAIMQPFSSSSITSSTKMPLTHRRLKQFVTEEFDLCPFGLAEGCR